jgi:hypothetical protein
MGSNIVAGGKLLDLVDLQVTGEESPRAGTATEVTVSFRFAEPFYSAFLRPSAWPYTIKVYAEGYGDLARELQSEKAGTCTQASPDFEERVSITFDREGVYMLSAIVELDKKAGFVMGFSEKQVQISAWTAM